MSFFGFGPPSRRDKTIIPREKFRGPGDHGYQTSDAMQQLLSDKSIEKLLNRPEEKRAFFKEIEKYGRDMRGLTVNDMRKVLGSFRSKTGDSIDRIESNKLADRLIPSLYKGEKRFLKEAPKQGAEPPKKKSSSLFPF